MKPTPVLVPYSRKCAPGKAFQPSPDLNPAIPNAMNAACAGSGKNLSIGLAITDRLTAV